MFTKISLFERHCPVFIWRYVFPKSSSTECQGSPGASPSRSSLSLEAAAVTYEPVDMWQPCRLDSEFGRWTAAIVLPFVAELYSHSAPPERRISDQQREPKFLGGSERGISRFYDCAIAVRGSTQWRWWIRNNSAQPVPRRFLVYYIHGVMCHQV